MAKQDRQLTSVERTQTWRDQTVGRVRDVNMKKSQPAKRSLMRLALAMLAIASAASAQQPSRHMPGVGPQPTIAPPYTTPSAMNFSRLVGWKEGEVPLAPDGFQVTAFATGLDHPRWVYVLPNGDVLVAESRTKPPKADSAPTEMIEGFQRSGATGMSANRITLLRDADRDGTAEVREILVSDLNQPFGMALMGKMLYVANTDAVLRFPYEMGQTRITASGTKIMDLPAGGYNNHWTRNLLASRDGSKLYVTVGSDSNNAERGIDKEIRRANVLEISPDGTDERIYGSGLRNPNGLAFEPVTGRLWTAVNERDGLGDDLVPDYITGVEPGGFYGWPFSYWGRNPDPRMKGRPELVAKALTPDYALGSHTASLGLTFYTGAAFPASYRGGAFVAQHGSWNRAEFSGYKVVFVPFRDGRPSGPPQDFLTGFMNAARPGEVRGRPSGLAVMPDGSLLVADGAGNAVWRVSAASDSDASTSPIR